MSLVSKAEAPATGAVAELEVVSRPPNHAERRMNRRMTKEQFRKHLDMTLPDKQHPGRYSMAQWWGRTRPRNLHETRQEKVTRRLPGC